MHPKSPCRSVIDFTTNLSEQRYALRLVVVTCRYFPSPSPSFQPISSSPSSHLSSVAVPHLLCRHIHSCCPASPPPCLSATVFTTDLVFRPYYPAYPPRLLCCPPVNMLRSLSYYLPSFRVLHRRCLSTFSDRVFFWLCVILYYTAFSALLHTNFLTLCSDILTKLFFSPLERLFSLSVMFLLRSDLTRFSPLAFTPLCSNLIIRLRSICSNLLAPSMICSNMIALLILLSACSDLL